ADLEDTSVWNNPDLPSIEIKADVTEELGSEVNVLFTIDAPPVKTEETVAAASDEGADDSMPLLSEDTTTFCARVDARTKARPGDRVRLSVDPARFHFFDPSTG